MALSRRVPNTIAVMPSQMPPDRIIDDLVAIEAITPGMLVELHNDSGALKWGVHDSANEPAGGLVALDEIALNHGIDTAYSAGDRVKVGCFYPGDMFYGLIPSGQNITQGALLQSNGNGTLKAFSTGPGGFMAASTTGAVTENTRLWVQKL